MIERNESVLCHYEFLLQDLGKRPEDFNLPTHQHQWEPANLNPLIAEELGYDDGQEERLRVSRYDQLNDDQRAHFDAIITAIAVDPSNAHFFLQGPAGTGKTTLYKALCHHFRAARQMVLCVASSGIAATLLPGGRTSHSRFKIRLQPSESSTCCINANSQLADLMRSAKLIIWDEVPMQHRCCFEAVDRTLRDIRRCDSVFGGLPVILGGDFAQILPVVLRGGRAAAVRACLQRSYLWPSLRQLRLTRNMCLQSDPISQAYAAWLGRLSYDSTLYDSLNLPQQVRQTRDLADFLESVFPLTSLQVINDHPDYFRSRAILTVRNEIAADLNQQLLDRLPGDEVVKFSVDSRDDGEADNSTTATYPAEYLQACAPGGLPLFATRLKVGAPVMLLRNLDPKQGLCNGARMAVTRIGNHLIEGRLLGGDFHNEVRVLPRIRMTTADGVRRSLALHTFSAPISDSIILRDHYHQGTRTVAQHH